VEQPAPVTVNYFYDSLAPYGAWVDVEGYGRCWRPTVMVVNAGWQPYCDHGHWVYTDAGWYWISDYSWGWAPFHYGRWFHHASFGWCWAPDTVWGPSWVTWRYSDDYCGWAPLPPRAVFREGVGFVYNGAGVSIGFDFGLDAGAFTFVHTRDFCDSHPWRHRVESREARQIFNRTTVINSFDVDRSRRSFINRGIDPGRITTATRTEIHPVAIRDTTGPAARGERLERDGRTLMVNRPHFSDNPSPSNPGAMPHATPPSPAIGSPYQQSHNGDKNNNLQPQRSSQPMPPVRTPGQRQIPPVTTPGSPVRNGMVTPTGLSPRYAPVAPVQPQAPNYNSTDDRRYPSPKMQQTEQQSPRANPGNTGVGTPITTREHTPITTQEHTPITTREHTPITTQEHTPITTREHTPITTQEHTPITTQEHTPITTQEHTPITTREHTPITTQEHTPITTREHTPITTRVPANSPEANHFTPPSQPSAPAQPPPHNYVSPRNEQLQNESRPNNNSQNSQPAAAGNQSRGSSEPSSPPAQSQRSGRDKNQNGQ
jgi:hypothetical protein